VTIVTVAAPHAATPAYHRRLDEVLTATGSASTSALASSVSSLPNDEGLAAIHEICLSTSSAALEPFLSSGGSSAVLEPLSSSGGGGGGGASGGSGACVSSTPISIVELVEVRYGAGASTMCTSCVGGGGSSTADNECSDVSHVRKNSK
jgi:hypothetical protein